MSEVSYTPLIEGMTWSYSRIKAYEDCPYKWFLRYIKFPMYSKNMFFASYGSFMHKLIEWYLKGEKSKEELCDIYIGEFRKYVFGSAPNIKIFENYFMGGLNYLRTIEFFPFDTIAVEKEVNFTVDGYRFKGFIDHIGKDDNGYIITDNKSRILKYRSKRSAPTKADKDLDEYLRQLYLYSCAINEETGVYPRKLCFNCFRNNSFVEEDFDDSRLCEAKKWAVDRIEAIKSENEFRPNIEFFKCNYLCEMQDKCEYFEMSRR